MATDAERIEAHLGQRCRECHRIAPEGGLDESGVCKERLTCYYAKRKREGMTSS